VGLARRLREAAALNRDDPYYGIDPDDLEAAADRLERPAIAQDLWNLFSGAVVACQDCFTVELTFDPAVGPCLFAHSCTLERPLGPFTQVADLIAAVHAAEVEG
jgi:hypothetical protein